LDIDAPFKIGNVEFEILTNELFDKIKIKLEENMQRNRVESDKIKEFFETTRTEYQGMVFANICVNAERNRAIEIAEEEVERALHAIRFFSIPAFFSELTAYFGRKGHSELPISYLLVYENEIPEIVEFIPNGREISFGISGAILERMFQSGLSKLSELLERKKLTEFEDLICSTVFTFSRALSKRNFHDKLTFILSSAEIAFLKDYSEPIQQNLGQRLGFYIFDQADSRMKVERLTKDAYEIRSKYLHHGHYSYNYEILEELQFVVREALSKMIKMSDKFEKKEDFIQHIREIIYS
jgi:hypothetical protein